jgi:hypothetical protein
LQVITLQTCLFVTYLKWKINNKESDNFETFI